MRGLDYYTATVFEWTTSELGAQGAVCGGGRYDNLVAEIGGPANPAIGFAIGLERLVALLEAQSVELPVAMPHAYLASAGSQASILAHAVAERLRDAVPECASSSTRAMEASRRSSSVRIAAAHTSHFCSERKRRATGELQ